MNDLINTDTQVPLFNIFFLKSLCKLLYMNDLSAVY